MFPMNPNQIQEGNLSPLDLLTTRSLIARKQRLTELVEKLRSALRQNPGDIQPDFIVTEISLMEEQLLDLDDMLAVS